MAFGVRPSPHPSSAGRRHRDARGTERRLRSKLEPPLRPASRRYSGRPRTPAIAVDDQGRAVVAWACGDRRPRTDDLPAPFPPGTGNELLIPVPKREVPIYKFPVQDTRQDDDLLDPRPASPDGKRRDDLARLGRSRRRRPRGPVHGRPLDRWSGALGTGRGTVQARSAPGFTPSNGADGTPRAARLDGRNQGQQPFLSSETAAAAGLPALEQLAPSQAPTESVICSLLCDLSIKRGAGAKGATLRRSSSNS